MKYYLLENNVPTGPYSKLELRNKHIRHDALVYPEDGGDWKQAIEVEELQYLFPNIPQPMSAPRGEADSSDDTSLSSSQNENPKSQTQEGTPGKTSEFTSEQEPLQSGDDSQVPELPKASLQNESSQTDKTATEKPAETSPDSGKKPKISLKARSREKTTATNKPLQPEVPQVQPKTSPKPIETPPPSAQEKHKTLREKLAPLLHSISNSALWAQLVKWKWYLAAFSAVLLGAWLVTAIAEMQRENREKKVLDLWLSEQDSIRQVEKNRQDSIRREEEGKKEPAYVIECCQDTIRQHEGTIVQLEQEIIDLKRREQTHRQTLRQAQADFRGRRPFERPRTYRERQRAFQENTVAPLQAKIDDSVQKIKQKNAGIKTLRQEIARLKQRIEELQSAGQGQPEG